MIAIAAIMLFVLCMGWYPRPPDEVIGLNGNDYLHRWYITPRMRWGRIYLHHILRSDEDRADHDHRADNCSLILWRGYREWQQGKYRDHGPGSIICRRAEQAHRLELLGGPAWTLFFYGRQRRRWGYHCADGWVPWEEFDDHGGCP